MTELVPGKVYQQGNVKDLVEMMQWQGKGVLYFGDHVFSDLAVSWTMLCDCMNGLWNCRTLSFNKAGRQELSSQSSRRRYNMARMRNSSIICPAC